MFLYAYRHIYKLEFVKKIRQIKSTEQSYIYFFFIYSSIDYALGKKKFKKSNKHRSMSVHSHICAWSFVHTIMPLLEAELTVKKKKKKN